MRRGDYIFIIIVFIAFYVLNQFSVLIGDDFWYCFYGVDANGTAQFIDSFGDAVCSQLHAYTTHNGRIIVHTLTSYFCGVLGMNVFKIFNSLVFILMFYGLVKLSRKYIGYKTWDKYLIIFMLFVLMPYPGQIFWGSIAMSINYLWTSCAVIYLLIFYEYIKEHKIEYNPLGNIVVFLISILAGSLQESFTIGISGALFLYYCFHYKEFKGTVPYFVIGLWIGTAIVVFAPGNFLRLEGVDKAQSASGFISSLSNFARLFTDTKLMIIVIVLSIILWSKNRVQIYNFYKENFVYIWSIIFNAFLVLITYSGERQLTCIELLSLILVLRLLLHFSTPIRIKKIELVYSILLSVVCLLLYYPIYNYRKSAFNTYTELANSPVINHTIVNRSYYYYRHREGSICLSFDLHNMCKKSFDRIAARWERLQFVESHPEYHAALNKQRNIYLAVGLAVMRIVAKYPQNFPAGFFDDNKRNIQSVEHSQIKYMEEYFNRRKQIELFVLCKFPLLFKLIYKILPAW